jgi:dTMP kinase
MKKVRFYGKGLPKFPDTSLPGLLIVLEGADGCGRTTQSTLLREWLERLGYPAIDIGLKRSALVGQELEQAMHGNLLCPSTLSLFYATDFADQLERNIIPALRAGFVVIADRYIYTLMVRDIARGVSAEWIRDVYGMALIPDVVVYLKVGPRALAERLLQKEGMLDYWESGMDIQRSGDVYQCFIRYQTLIAQEFTRLEQRYKFETVNGAADPFSVHAEIQKRITPLLSPRAGRAKLKAAPIVHIVPDAPGKSKKVARVRKVSSRRISRRAKRKLAVGG